MVDKKVLSLHLEEMRSPEELQCMRSLNEHEVLTLCLSVGTDGLRI